VQQGLSLVSNRSLRLLFNLKCCNVKCCKAQAFLLGDPLKVLARFCEPDINPREWDLNFQFSKTGGEHGK